MAVELWTNFGGCDKHVNGFVRHCRRWRFADDMFVVRSKVQNHPTCQKGCKEFLEPEVKRQTRRRKMAQSSHMVEKDEYWGYMSKSKLGIK
jgi:hypothetical protein